MRTAPDGHRRAHAAHAAQALIIDRPELQGARQRTLSGVLTGVFWLLWVALWLPLATLFGWSFFGYQFQFYMVRQGGYASFLDVLAIYALVIVAMSGALMAWAKYNHLRFRGMDRRRASQAPALADVARLHGLAAQDLRRWQEQAIVSVHHDAQGRITRVQG